MVGSIMNLFSMCGQIAAALLTPYCVSKGAVRMLTMALAVELAPARIRVASIQPGPVATLLGLGGSIL
jgi:NAD(P)-dependent dehydrogenase (short-subunit alcohol dehydrogenase family)